MSNTALLAVDNSIGLDLKTSPSLKYHLLKSISVLLRNTPALFAFLNLMDDRRAKTNRERFTEEALIFNKKHKSHKVHSKREYEDENDMLSENTHDMSSSFKLSDQEDSLKGIVMSPQSNRMQKKTRRVRRL